MTAQDICTCGCGWDFNASPGRFSRLNSALSDAMDILDPPGNLIGAMASIELRQTVAPFSTVRKGRA